MAKSLKLLLLTMGGKLMIKNVIAAMMIVVLSIAQAAWSESGKQGRDCLAEALYFEARSEGEQGKRLVGYVIHNRVLDKYWPNTYCSVIYQKYQFEYVSRKLHKGLMRGKAKKMSYQIADEILALPKTTVFNNSRWYHATWMKKWPKWTHKGKGLKKFNVYKNHVFYVER